MEDTMTVSNNFMMAQQLYTNKKGESNRGVSDFSPDQGAAAIPSFSDIAQQMLAVLDTNKSGSIDKTEFSQAAQALAKSSGKADTTGVESAFANADANNDGQISSDEFMNALKLATEQMQKKNQRHQYHSDVTASNTLPQAESTQASTALNEMQKNLFNKVTAAYANPVSLTGLSTNISA